MSKGEKYASKKAMMKHEKSEGSKERKMEYGKKAAKKVAKKVAKKSMPKDKMAKIMHEWKMGTLHSGKGPAGPKKGAVVKSRKQAVAIGLSQTRKSGRGR